MPLYTDHGSSDLGREGKRAGCKLEGGGRARNKKKKVYVCQHCVARVGCSVPGDTKKRQGVRFPNTVPFNSALTAPFSSFPCFCIFHILLIPLHC